MRVVTVDRVAATGFQVGADAYERARPSYPPGAVAWLAERLGVAAGSRVADLGAGTGKLTTSLVDLGLRVVAVEPVEGMRAQLAATLSAVPVVAGTAEHMPLADGSVDAVVAAQAFHWFDPTRALPEIRRVLVPSGGLGLVWNARDRSAPWVAALSEIVDTFGDVIRRHESGEWRKAFPAPGFGRLEERVFPNVQRITPDGVVDRVASTSFVASMPEDERDRVLERIRTLIRTHPETKDKETIDFPHLTRVYWCRRT